MDTVGDTLSLLILSLTLILMLSHMESVSAGVRRCFIGITEQNSSPPILAVSEFAGSTSVSASATEIRALSPMGWP